MFRNRWRDYFENVIVAIFLALFVRTFIMTGYKVPSNAMSPILLPGDFIFSYRLPYGLKIPLTQIRLAGGEPKRSEIIVFTFPDQPRVNFVKRVIGLPGDRIEIKNNELFINEIKMNNSDSLKQGVDIVVKNFGPIVVPPNEVFVLGDNWNSNDDFRSWGTVPIDRIEGKVILIWLSLDWSSKEKGNILPKLRSERIFSTVD